MPGIIRICSFPGCQNNRSLYGKYAIRNLDHPVNRVPSQRLSQCIQHNVCMICGHTSRWDESLCYLCDTNK